MNQLGEDSAHRHRMKECDPCSSRAGSGVLVDQTDPFGAQLVQRTLDIAHEVGDVVQSGAASAQEPAHWSVRGEGAEELDVRGAHREQDLLDTLIGHALAVRGLCTKCVSVQLDRGFQVIDRDPDVLDVGEADGHGFSLTARRLGRE